jgi:hypothetical protein
MAALPCGPPHRTAGPCTCRGPIAPVADPALRRIAAEILAERNRSKPTEADIACFWPKIYDENRAVIGDDPDLILPGQLLEIPEDDCGAAPGG